MKQEDFERLIDSLCDLSAEQRTVVRKLIGEKQNLEKKDEPTPIMERLGNSSKKSKMPKKEKEPSEP